MGWLTMPLSSMHPHATPKTYLDAQFTYDRRDNDGNPLQPLRVVAESLDSPDVVLEMRMA